jgi:hypothetical protein
MSEKHISTAISIGLFSGFILYLVIKFIFRIGWGF